MSARILIADDHAAVRQMLKLIVETHAGWQVCGEAENGVEAVAKAVALNPDLIIMDLAMPVMDGIRASREILAAAPSMPILMHTLHYSPELELEAKKVGIRRVVAKAEGGEKLLTALELVLNENHRSANGSANVTLTPSQGDPRAAALSGDPVGTASMNDATDRNRLKPD